MSVVRQLLAVAILVAILGAFWFVIGRTSNTSGTAAPRYATVAQPRSSTQGKMTVFWDSVPESVRAQSIDGGEFSNIRKSDYVGAETCKECHRTMYDAWSKHPHRWMNALATDDLVKGDFSGDQSIEYLGGVGEFYKSDGKLRMRLKRGQLTRTYNVTQTIGSRFFQYYVGHQVEGPEEPDHSYFKLDHVLPFGYWLSRQEWVPIVHVDEEMPDGERNDPYKAPQFLEYAVECTHCHTTKSMGDWLLRKPDTAGEFSPRSISLWMAAYMADSHPDMLPAGLEPTEFAEDEIINLKQALYHLDARDHAVNLGVSCEACHNGCAEHVADPDNVLPRFYPSSPHTFATAKDSEELFGRTTANKNWICSRCHSGDRPQFAGGMSTWNSTEFSDASRGSCYSQMTCVHCHDPHTPIGQEWKPTPDQDDAKCLNCHTQFELPAQRAAHTHHATGSEGARCMNCHMPKVNEGLEHVVRTHTISSPTNKMMIESNHPNACNLCHLDKPIDWTLSYLQEWYSVSFQEEAISLNYPRRGEPTGVGWLNSTHEPTRLVSAWALNASKSEWALPHLIDVLDDPYLMNRQFGQKGLEDWFEIRFKQFGYKYYMVPSERKVPIAEIRDALETIQNQRN